jgi:hypothetical protein
MSERKVQTHYEACKAIEKAARRRASHLANESPMKQGRSGKLRNLMQREREMFADEADQW